MPGLPQGLNRAFKIFLGGFIFAAVVRTLLATYKLHYLIIIFDVLSIIAIILLFQKMKYWSLSYLFGWILGLVIFFSILSPWEIVLYVVIGIFMLYLKIKRKF